MSRLIWFGGVACLLGGCVRPGEQPAPPEARRPRIKSEQELARERAAAIRAGRVVPSSAPVILAGQRRSRPVRRRLPDPVRPAPGAIEAEILLVNDQQLTVAEVLYPLRERLAEAWRAQTAAGFHEQALRMISAQTQRELGRLLVYKEATAGLDERQRQVLDKAVSRALERRVAREFGGSRARLVRHLTGYGLTLDQYRERLRRAMVVSQYTREKFRGQAYPRREELLSYYQANRQRYCAPGTRELLIIAAPAKAFLPEGLTWETASPAARTRARLAAGEHIRKAYAALQQKPFREVARAFSRGLHAESGGSWGQIGRPLRPPYERISRLIFDFSEGQHSEPVQTPEGWYIVGCGKIHPPSRTPFAAVQERIRAALTEQQLNRLTAEYVLGLAAKATISSLDQFVAAAVRRASREPWTGARRRAAPGRR